MIIYLFFVWTCLLIFLFSLTIFYNHNSSKCYQFLNPKIPKKKYLSNFLTETQIIPAVK